MQSKRSCPECHLIFDAELPETGGLVCPLCNCVFATQPPAISIPAVASPLPSAAAGRQVWRGVLAVGTVLVLAGGIGYAYHLLDGIDHKAARVPTPAATAPPAVAAPAASAPPAPATERPFEVIPIIPGGPTPVTTIQSPRLSPRWPPPQPFAALQETSPPLSLPERINHAIDRGVAALRAPHKAQVRDRRALGLLGLTLLECGVSADDPTVQQLAAEIRAGARQSTQTYELTLAILFLDRLGDPSDRALIRKLGQQLLSGQLDCGAWTYSSLLSQRLASRTNFWNSNYPARQRIVYRGDNSNTQFAILGLWVAQRYGVPVHAALMAAEKYFRNTQADDGSWSYQPSARHSRDSMTCAGLMSLAMRHGISAGQGRDIRPDSPISVQDAAIDRGLRYLAQSLDKITVRARHIQGIEARDPLYFLWSLERVATIYDLKTIGEREWYPWAAQMLVQTQWADGRWMGLGDPVGTCFALLVLKRSNLAKDLQLTVQEPPPQPRSDISGPIILQGPDAFLGQTGKLPSPAAPLGPSITKTPRTK